MSLTKELFEHDGSRTLLSPQYLNNTASYSLVLLLFPFSTMTEISFVPLVSGLFSFDSASSADAELCPGKELWFVSLGHTDSFSPSAFLWFCVLAFQLERTQLSRSFGCLSHLTCCPSESLCWFGRSSLPSGLSWSLLILCRCWSCQGSYWMFWGDAFHLVCYQCLSVWFFCPGFSDVFMGGFRET